MFQRQDLAAIAQGALREQSDFGETVEHNAVRLHAFERLENPFCRLAEFEIGGIKQALLLVFVEQAFGWHQFEYIDAVEHPAVRGRSLAQLILGFGDRDVEGLLSRRRAGKQELRRNRGLAGARAALDEKEAPALKAAGGDIVQPSHSGGRSSIDKFSQTIRSQPLQAGDIEA